MPSPTTIGWPSWRRGARATRCTCASSWPWAAMATAGLGLLDTYRVNDGVTLLQRAVDHGAREPQMVLRLAQMLANTGREKEAALALGELEGQGLTPFQEAERAHIQSLSHMFTAPEDVLDALAESARRWADVGAPAKEGWA